MTSVSGNQSNLDKLLGKKKTKNNKKNDNDKKTDKTQKKQKISDEARRIHKALIKPQEVLDRISGLTKKQAKDIAERLNDKLVDDAIAQKGLAKPKTLNQLRNERLQSLLNANGKGRANTKALNRIQQAVKSLSPSSQIEMGELAMEFQVLQTKIVSKAREMINADTPKTDWQKIKADGQREQLLDLIKQSNKKQGEAIKKLAQSYR